MKWYCRSIGRYFLIDFIDPPCFFTTDKGTGGRIDGHERCGFPGKHERPEEVPLAKPSTQLGAHEKNPNHKHNIAPTPPPGRRYHNWEFCNNPNCKSGHW